MTDVEAAFDRQEQIWGGLFGPPQARKLIDEARAQLQDKPGADVVEVLRSIDAGLHDDDDPDEAGTMRPI
ncbi:MAG: hypothetical protein ACRBK7_23715 [Acidimicrobiales bacterium]